MALSQEGQRREERLRRQREAAERLAAKWAASPLTPGLKANGYTVAEERYADGATYIKLTSPSGSVWVHPDLINYYAMNTEQIKALPPAEAAAVSQRLIDTPAESGPIADVRLRFAQAHPQIWQQEVQSEFLGQQSDNSFMEDLGNMAAAPFEAAAVGDPLRQALSGEEVSWNPDTNVNRMMDTLAEEDTMNERVGEEANRDEDGNNFGNWISDDDDYSDTGKIVGGLAGLFFGGQAAGAGSGSSGTAAGAGGGAAASGSGGTTGGTVGGAGAGAAASGGWGQTATDVGLGLLPSALGYLGSKEAAEAQERLSREYMAMGAPYRGRLAELYDNPNSFLSSDEVQVPIQQGTNMVARSLSAGGNPIGSGNALQALNDYSSNKLFSRLGEEKDRLAGFGGLSSYNQAAPQAAQNSIDADSRKWDSYGVAAESLNDIFGTRRNRARYDSRTGQRLY